MRFPDADFRRVLRAQCGMQVLVAPGPLRFQRGPGVLTNGSGLLGKLPQFPGDGVDLPVWVLGCWTGVFARICPGSGPGRGSQGRARPFVWWSLLRVHCFHSPFGQHGCAGSTVWGTLACVVGSAVGKGTDVRRGPVCCCCWGYGCPGNRPLFPQALPRAGSTAARVARLRG